MYVALRGFWDAKSQSSWMPESAFISSDRSNVSGNNIVLSGPGFQDKPDPKGRLVIADNDDRSIIRRLEYYSSQDLIDENCGLKNVRAYLLDDSTMIINGSGLIGTEVSIFFIAQAYMPRLDIKVNPKYTRHPKVAREALVASFDLPVSEVYKRNRTIDYGNFSPEY